MAVLRFDVLVERAGPTFRSRSASVCFSVASAMAVSQIFDHGSGETTKNASNSRLKILSPIGLSSRTPTGRHDARPSRW